MCAGGADTDTDTVSERDEARKRRAGRPPASRAPPLVAACGARPIKRLYQQSALPNKPRNAVGWLRDLPPAGMAALLLAHILITEESMRELALQRGLAVRDALIVAGLPSDRLFLAVVTGWCHTH